MRKKINISNRMLTKYIVNPLNGCWEWQGGKNNVGYGFVRDGKRMRTAHRVSYELHVGPITNNLHVLHNCDNKKCINPNHLRLGTHSDNMTDKYERNPHAFTYGKCTHCGIETSTLLIKRWHNDRCKQNPMTK